MRAIILAAGRGSRMTRLTEDAPKCLVQFRGKTLLSWQIDSLKAAGIQQIGIVTGYKRELLQSYGLSDFLNARWAETNMVASLKCAYSWLQSEPCIVSYSDLFYKPGAVTSLIKSEAQLAITYDPNWHQLWEGRFQNPLEDAETFQLNPWGQLIEIGGKPTRIEEVEGQYMGLLKFTPASWGTVDQCYEGLPKSAQDCIHMTGMLKMLVHEKQFPVAAIPYHDEWFEFDSISDLNAAEKLLRG